jgi:hypothetical protein
LARGGLGLLLLVGPPLQDIVAQFAYRVDDALLGDRRFLDVAPRVLDDVQHPLDFRAQPRILVQSAVHIRPAEDRRFAVGEPF